MRIRIFRAPTRGDAMAQVREALGLDALILSTDTRAGLVEVTVALEDEDEPELPVTRLDLPGGLAGAVPGGAAGSGRVDGDAFRRHGLPPALAASLTVALEGGSSEIACSRTFRFGRLPVDADGMPLLLSGPFGSGKTLTVAKLATRLVLEGHRPLVITADDRRAGGVEQLAAFTRLLGLTLIAVGEPEQLQRALRRREAGAPALIDAPALDPRDPDEERMLGELIDAARPNLALVLPCGLDPAEAEEVGLAHAALGARLLVPTRLDRNGRLGGVLAASQGAGLVLTEAGTGSGVADGLTPLTPALLAARLGPLPVRGSDPVPVLASPPPGGTALSLHIAAQAIAHRPASRRIP